MGARSEPADEVVIRSAVVAHDAAACAALYAPYVTDSVVSFEEEPPDAGEMARRIAHAHAWLVAEDDDGVAGFAYGGTHRSRAAYRWTVETSVYVDARAHRRGVARALYAELLDDLGARGFRLALAGVTLPNPASVGFHESAGFEPVGVFRRIGWKAGAWHDVGWWQRDLGPADPAAPPREPS